MHLKIVSTGSSGNCYILESNGRRMILDLGIPWKSVIGAINFNRIGIDGALISHDHQDHSYSVMNAIRYSIPCFGLFEPCTVLTPVRWSKIGDWYVLPFDAKHTNNDGSDCESYGFIIKKDSETFCYLTDLMYCKYNLKPFEINHFLIGVNYTDLPDDERKMHVLKGHCSLDTAKAFIENNITDNTRTVIACHLSEIHADPDRIYTELNDITPDSVKVYIAENGARYQL